MKTLFKEGIQRIDFKKFKPWAELNLNIYHLINSFEVVPSPSKERLTIMQILQKEEQKHGDTMYVLNYRWWDSWKSYTSTHQSTLYHDQHIQKVKLNINSEAEPQTRPESEKQFMRQYIGTYDEEAKIGIDEVIKGKEMAPYKKRTLKSDSFSEGEADVGEEQPHQKVPSHQADLLGDSQASLLYSNRRKLELEPINRDVA